MNRYVLSIGELLADVITNQYCNSLSDATDFNLVQGGSAANVAANINYLGGHAKLISCVGNDGIGQLLISGLKKSGLDSFPIQIHATEPSSIVMVTKSRGTPDFIAYRHADACITAFDNSLLEEAAVIHTTAFALSKQPAQNTILLALQKAGSQNKTISIDWNFSPQIWGAEDGNMIFEKVMSLRPLLKISMDDMERFWHRPLTIEECKNILEQYDALLICLTCGKDGMWFKEALNSWQYQQAEPIENIIDVTGAGDAFWAGFLTAFLENEKIETCVRKGASTAARKIQKSGALYE